MRFFLMLLNLFYMGTVLAATDVEDTLDISGCSLESAQVFKYPIDELPYAGELLSMTSSYNWSGATSSLLISQNVAQTAGTITKTLTRG